jgi:hypothetical protein
MILNHDIHDQLAAAHRRDLLEAADHRATQAQQRLGVPSFRFASPQPRPRPRARLDRCFPSSTPSR